MMMMMDFRNRCVATAGRLAFLLTFVFQQCQQRMTASVEEWQVILWGMLLLMGRVGLTPKNVVCPVLSPCENDICFYFLFLWPFSLIFLLPLYRYPSSLLPHLHTHTHSHTYTHTKQAHRTSSSIAWVAITSLFHGLPITGIEDYCACGRCCTHRVHLGRRHGHWWYQCMVRCRWYTPIISRALSRSNNPIESLLRYDSFIHSAGAA